MFRCLIGPELACSSLETKDHGKINAFIDGTYHSMREFLATLRRLGSFLLPTCQAEDESIWRHVLRAMPIILLCAGFTAVIHHHTDILTNLEYSAVDLFQRADPLKIERTFVVDIDDNDYKDLFSGKSPLDYKMLAEAVRWIGTGQPEAIVVDINTEEPEFKELRKSDLSDVDVIWARPALTGHDDETGLETSAHEHGGHGLPEVSLLPVLGEQEADQIHAGLALMTPDKDGVIRSYQRSLAVKSADGAHKAAEHEDSLPWAAVKLVEPSLANKDTESARRFLNFSRYPRKYPGYPLSRIRDLYEKNRESLQQLLGGRIVILGGTYRAARDLHATPTGLIPGSYLIGYAIESELQGKTVGAVDQWILFLADLVSGILFVLALHKLPRDRALVWSLLAFPVLGWVFSFFSFKLLGIWISFIPVMFGVYLHFLHDHMEEDTKLRERLRELEELSLT